MFQFPSFLSFCFFFFNFIYDDKTHYNKEKKTLQRQISSIPARHDKHDIARDIALKTLEKKNKIQVQKTKTNKKQTNINCHEELAFIKK